MIYAVAAWDSQLVILRARKDPDNSGFFANVSPAGITELVETGIAVGGMAVFGLAVCFARGSNAIALAALLFAAANLAWRLILGRRFRNRSMQLP